MAQQEDKHVLGHPEVTCHLVVVVKAHPVLGVTTEPSACGARGH